MARIHPTALVEDGAALGADVEIGPFCHVGARVTLADGVRLLSHVTIAGVTSIGMNTVVHPHAALGGEGQIRGNDFADGRLEIGADCVLREMVSMNVGSRKGGGITTVGARGYFMANAHVGHDCHVGDDVTFANSVALGGHSQIGDRVIFGGLSAVQQFCRVGTGAMVGGLTGINRDVIPYAMAFGDHAELAGLNLIGLKRRGLTRGAINALRGAFRAIFHGKGGSIELRARDAKSRWPDVAEVGEIVDFILADAKQPLCLARRRGEAQ
jgi:UDP-N-acetylglucosamine acyltransferase